MLARPVVFLSFACVALSASAAPKPIEVSIRKLVANPQRFHGKTVAVTGWFECAFEAGCELRFTRSAQDRIKTILLELSQDQAVALEKTHPLRGWLRVIGRFEYSRPTPERVIHKADPRDPSDRGIVEIWQGFDFHACRITVAQFQRI
jgi:hypothetical protein